MSCPAPPVVEGGVSAGVGLGLIMFVALAFWVIERWWEHHDRDR